MPKEWLLNIATNRWGLNKKDSVGPVAQWIRECSPKSIEEWENYYYKKLEEFLQQKNIPLTPKDYLLDLGARLYTKITENIRAEIDEITEEDCINYIKNLVIVRTFEGYKREIETVYGYLQKALGVKIIPAPDDWDRKYNVDFYIKIGEGYIGLQIKPITYEQTPEIHKWKEWLKISHEKFIKNLKGPVFTIFTIKKEGKKVIYNEEVINEIKKVIEELKKSYS